MDAREFVHEVALKSYEDSQNDPASFHRLSSAIEQMNRVAEHLGHQRVGYANVPTHVIHAEIKGVRQQYPELQVIKDHDEMLKHVRLHGQLTKSSTGISPDDPTTWGSLRQDLDRAVACLSNVAEIK